MGKGGGPTILLYEMIMVVMLLPVIIIEAMYLSKHLIQSFRRSILITATSNIISTYITIPASWVILVYCQACFGGYYPFDLNTFIGKILSVTLQAPWIRSFQDDQYDWLIPFADLFLLIPFFFVAWWTKYRITAWFLKDIDKFEIKKKTRNANVITFILLLISTVIFWIIINVYNIK